MRCHLFEKARNYSLLIALLVMFLSVLPSVVLADQAGAADSISNARSQLLSCFDSVKEAEAAGANITELTGILNRAGLLLSQAEFEFSMEDFVAAQDYAVQSQNNLANFVSESNALLFSASTRENQDFQINVVGSIAGTIAILAGSLGLYAFLKRRRIKNGKERLNLLLRTGILIRLFLLKRQRDL